MRAGFRSAIAVITLIVGLSSAAVAQFEPTYKSVVGVRMSVLRPLDSSLEDLSGGFTSPAIDYNISFDSQDRPTRSISIASFGRETGGRKAKFVPLTYNYIRRHFDDEESKGWYTGFGLGIALVRLEGYVGFDRPTSSSTNLGLTLVGGYEINEAWFAEVAYNNFGSLSNPAFGNVTFHGLSISVGTRIAY